MLDRVVAEKVPHWTCPDCGTTYFGATGKFQFCPVCRSESDRKKAEYWAKETAGQRSIAQSIVSQILAKKSNMEG